MPFINEIPSAEDIEKYGLPYKNDVNLPMRLRSQWTVDRERNFHLYGGGATANQAYEEIFYYRFYLYLNGTKFVVELDVDPNRKPPTFKDNPYVIVWSKLMSIKVWPHDQVSPLKRVPPAAWDTPDAPQSLLDNRSLNQFIVILKEALTVRGAGDANRNIHHPIVVHFGF
ncbi:hypothetical protein FG476_02480 [Xylella fastidiosa subsp. multiplex]|uniref:Uncharacterized protein n=1 Tax=Xylella fastidiosa subsp. multiplex TaxID=644357 RepID=A0A9Q4QRF8_XYLFS|nr:hypothetical protein [Xylella fastidiosa]ERI59196.1 hypothetical protein M233_10920 [Xylella fastidiosa subsp. multiplex Griffin-1]ACA11346.1 conserved hypothetical protein [Xylella fastidiosa M12]MBE0269651.1 hypothetical protein [Xylella fastidiosa subsp. multiplex]MBE0276220.1 hypothetical protein [Xylella fastidiosa subsp. multiplex]MBE0278452.1 hypothetical protein [Xylella fastidiosa subsp. multiplex]